MSKTFLVRDIQKKIGQKLTEGEAKKSGRFKGAITKKKTGKFGKNSQLGLIIQNFLNFRTF